MKVVTGHQPVYLPWLGLIHKASLADVFVFMNDVQYLEQDWNNRNRVKVSSGQAKWLTVPVDLKRSVSRRLCDILIAEEQVAEKKRWHQIHWSTLQASYGKAPYFKSYADFFRSLYLEQSWTRLSDLNLAILRQVFEWFEIQAEVVIATDFEFSGQKSDLILDHVKKLNANAVVLGAHGRDYLDQEQFQTHKILFYFQDYQHPVYAQRFGPFVSHLSFLDLLFEVGPRAKEVCLEHNVKRGDLWR